MRRLRKWNPASRKLDRVPICLRASEIYAAIISPLVCAISLGASLGAKTRFGARLVRRTFASCPCRLPCRGWAHGSGPLFVGVARFVATSATTWHWIVLRFIRCAPRSRGRRIWSKTLARRTSSDTHEACEETAAHMVSSFSIVAIFLSCSSAVAAEDEHALPFSQCICMRVVCIDAMVRGEGSGAFRKEGVGPSSRFALSLRFRCSPDGAQRNPGTTGTL
jgi:hypothetical protein